MPKRYMVKQGEAVRLKDWPTEYDGHGTTEAVAKAAYERQCEKLADLHERLYAHKKYGLMIIVQGLDASGKDGAIKHLAQALNPHGLKVTSFKRPSEVELAHEFLWRHHLAAPARGEIAMHNRSHYEYALGPRVFPEMVLNENMPHIKHVKDVTPRFWKERLQTMREFEDNLAESGTITLKFFLHVSKETQRKRLMDRLQEPEKNWKFKVEDLKVREHWTEYRKAYEHAIEATSTKTAPWYILPADTKWYARHAMLSIVIDALHGRHPAFPKLTKAQLEEFKQGLAILEGDG